MQPLKSPPQWSSPNGRRTSLLFRSKLPFFSRGTLERKKFRKRRERKALSLLFLTFFFAFLLFTCKITCKKSKRQERKAKKKRVNGVAAPFTYILDIYMRGC